MYILTKKSTVKQRQLVSNRVERVISINMIIITALLANHMLGILLYLYKMPYQLIRKEYNSSSKLLYVVFCYFFSPKDPCVE